MSKANLRRADSVDAGAIAKLMDAAYAIYASRNLDLPDVSAGIEADIRDHVVWVAEADEALVGAIVLSLGEDFVQVVNVAVAPESTGTGLGRRLLALADDLAPAEGKATLRLSTHKGIPENIALYAHLGWVESSREGAKVFMTKPVKRQIP